MPQLLIFTDDLKVARAFLVHKPKSFQAQAYFLGKLKEAEEGLESLTWADLMEKEWPLSEEETFFAIALSEEDKTQYLKKILPLSFPLCAFLSFSMETGERSRQDNEIEVSWSAVLENIVKRELRNLRTLDKVNIIQNLTVEADQVAILVQPDPDPDALASALALRTVLGRNKLSCPIVSFGQVTRPENLNMMRLLEIEVLSISSEDLNDYNIVLMVDTQPSHFKEAIPRLCGVIDHHPMGDSYLDVPYLDIRPQYGSTSSILWEYLDAAGINVGQRLATALVYGIKADTLFLNREVNEVDLESFVSLYPSVNYNLLRRIERPELPVEFAPILAKALGKMMFYKGILVSFLGKVEREDLIPQMADFLLQFQGAEWAICVGLFDDNVVFSVRNVGYVKSAGEAVKRIVQGFGYGGGHRSMAKGFIPLDVWREKFGSLRLKNIQKTLIEIFAEEVL